MACGSLILDQKPSRLMMREGRNEGGGFNKWHVFYYLFSDFCSEFSFFAVSARCSVFRVFFLSSLLAFVVLGFDAEIGLGFRGY